MTDNAAAAAPRAAISEIPLSPVFGELLFDFEEDDVPAAVVEEVVPEEDDELTAVVTDAPFESRRTNLMLFT